MLEGDFGTSFKPIVTWIQSLVSDEDKVNELWPEYSLEGDVEISTHLDYLRLDQRNIQIQHYVLSIKI